jgi:hypothetical protein
MPRGIANVSHLFNEMSHGFISKHKKTLTKRQRGWLSKTKE